MTTTPAGARGSIAATGRRLPRTLAFTLGNIGIVSRKVGFLVFTVFMPVAFYVLFNSLYGNQSDGATRYAGIIMVQMAAYGGLGAAISAGAQLQTERSTGWMRQLQLTGLSTRGFVTGKVLTALCVVLPALVAVFLAGRLVGGVHMAAADWLISALLVWLAMVPLVAWGVVVALAVRIEAVAPASTMSTLGLALLGGLWFPISQMPHWMRMVAPWTPSYWALRLGQWPLAGGGFPWPGVAVLAGWMLALAVLAALLVRRAVRSSRR